MSLLMMAMANAANDNKRAITGVGFINYPLINEGGSRVGQTDSNPFFLQPRFTRQFNLENPGSFNFTI